MAPHQKELTGVLKSLKDDDIRRLIIKMLVQKVLKEQFEATKFNGVINISVYLQLGKYSKHV